MRWILRVAFLLIGVVISILAFVYSLPFMIANGVTPTQAAYIAFGLAAVILSAWIGTLYVTIRFWK